MSTIHQLKVTLRGVRPPVWRRIHVPSTADLRDLHNVIQIAMGWENFHLHLFAKDWTEYGDNAKSEYGVTLARLLPKVGGHLGYRYDFGDEWDHTIVVEKIHQPAKNTLYPRCSAGGRACPPEDSGGPVGFAEHLRALRHKKGWKYREARHILGAGRWDGAAWDKDEVNAQLAELAKRWAARDAEKAGAPAAGPGPVDDGQADDDGDADDAEEGEGGAEVIPLEPRPGPRPGNGRLRDASPAPAADARSSSTERPETRPETEVDEIEFRDRFRDDGVMSVPAASAPAPSNAIRIGYARVSTRSQDHAAQLQLLNAADCREIVEETVSTRRADRPKLKATVAGLKAGDTLVITKPDRIARSMKELLVFLEDELAPRGVNLHILTGICAGIHRPSGQSIADKMLFMVAAMAAEMERDLISERTLDGLAAARAQGRTGGRPPAVTEDLLAAARARRARGQSIPLIAKELKVGRSTLYRALEADEPAAPAQPAAPADEDKGEGEKLLPEQGVREVSAPAVPESAGAAAIDAPAKRPRATSSRRTAKPEPADSGQDKRPYKEGVDPVHRRRWYTDDELDAVQVIPSGAIDGSYWVIVAGDLLGTVRPHLSARGTRSGWEARHRGGSAAWHLGAGKRPKTRDKAVADLIYDVKHAWSNNRRRT